MGPAPVRASDARQRTLLGLGAVSSLWVSVVFGDAGLIRLHMLKDASTGIPALAGAVAGPALIAIWLGFSGRPSVVVQHGRYFVSARTLTGVRTLRLDSLVSVRRYTTISRFGGYIDELRLRDDERIRLTVDSDSPVSTQVRQAVRRAESRPGSPVPATRHARTGLGLEPRSRLPEAVHRSWALLMLLASFWVPAMAGYAVARLLAGTA